MNDRPRWQDTLNAAQEIEARQRDRWVLLTLTQLPFLSEEILEQLAGVKRRGLYRTVGRLMKSGLVAAIAPPLKADHSPRLLYLTDLGVAALAVLRQVEPGPMAQRLRITRRHLIRLIPGLPVLQEIHRLLGAITASCPQPARLLQWERPWRRHFLRPTAKSPVRVEVPAFAELSWEGRSLEFLLLADCGHIPVRVYRSTLGDLVGLRAAHNGNLPPLVVATDGGRRADAWKRILQETADSRGEAPLSAHIADWRDLSHTLQGLTAFTRAHNHPPSSSDPASSEFSLKPRSAGRYLPRIVGSALTIGKDGPRLEERLAGVALSLSSSDRDLLDLVGRHPFLSCRQLALLLDQEVRRLRLQRDRLADLGLVRVVQPEEVPQRAPRNGERSSTVGVGRLELAELTKPGLELLAAQWGFSVGIASQFDALVGGGPEGPTGARSSLLNHIEHTLEANTVCCDLLLAALQLAKSEGDDHAFATWRSAAAAARGALRPDAYVMIDRGPRSFGFFLEYDRGTENARDYRRKFAAYYVYLCTGRFERDYEGFPTILIVTTDNAAERRIAQAAEVAFAGRERRLPLLLTSKWRIEDKHNPFGLLGPIWCEPSAGFSERRSLPLSTTTMPHSGPTRPR